MICNICKKAELEFTDTKDGGYRYKCPNCSNIFIIPKDSFKGEFFNIWNSKDFEKSKLSCICE